MDLAEFRAEKDRFMKTHPQSPLTPQQKRSFTGLKYYPENLDLRFDVSITPDPEQPTLEMATSSGESRPYIRAGSFQFPIRGKTYQLYVYRDEGGGDYFLPFGARASGRRHLSCRFQPGL